MPKTSYNLEQKSFVIEQWLNKLLEVPITITTNTKNLHLAPPWKQNTSGYNMTNNTQESHMLKFFVVPHLGNKLQVDTKWLMHKNKSWLLFHNSFQCWQLVCIFTFSTKMQTNRSLLKEEVPKPPTILEFFIWIWIHHAPPNKKWFL